MSADVTATFAMELQDQTSDPAMSAADALEKLKGKIADDVAALKAMNQAMRNLKGGTTTNVAAFRELRDQIAAQKASIASAQSAFIQLGGSFREMKEEASGAIPTDAATAFEAECWDAAIAAREAAAATQKLGSAAKGAGKDAATFTESAKKMPGPIGDTTRKLDDMSEALRNPRVLMLALGAGAAIAGGMLVGALLGAGVALGKFALQNARGASGITRQLDRMKRDVAGLFSGIKLDKFLRGLSQITSLFSQNTVTGRVLKSMMERVFQPIFDAVGEAMPYVRQFFVGMLIGIALVENATLRLRLWFRRTFGTTSLFSGIDYMNLAANAGIVVVGGLVAVLGLLALALGVVLAPFLLVGAAGFALGYGLGWLVDEGIPSLLEWFGRIPARVSAAFGSVRAKVAELTGSFTGIGQRLIDGLVGGIRAGISSVTGIIGQLASAMTDAIRDALGIHSPSRVFAELGIQIPRGVEVGVEAGAPDVSAAVADMVQVPTVPTATSGAGGATSSSPASSFSLVIERLEVVAPANDAPAIARSIREQLGEFLEGLAIQTGALADV